MSTDPVRDAINAMEDMLRRVARGAQAVCALAVGSQDMVDAAAVAWIGEGLADQTEELLRLWEAAFTASGKD